MTPDQLAELTPEARDAVLCYVADGIAYFTTQSLEKQTGDDWDDAPYEHNADPPYEPHYPCDRWSIYEVRYEEVDGLHTPAEDSGDAYYGNSRYSVDAINAGAVAWLTNAIGGYEPLVVVKAGATLVEFCGLIERAGGHVVLPDSAKARGEDA